VRPLHPAMNRRFKIQGYPKISLIVIAITLSTASQVAHVHSMKLATGEYTVSPSNTVRVSALPCEILITTLFMFTYIKQSTFNFCRKFVKTIIVKCIAMAAGDAMM